MTAATNDTIAVLSDTSKWKDVFYDWHGGNVWLFHKINDIHSESYDLAMRLITRIGDHHNFYYYMAAIAAFVLLSVLVRNIARRGGISHYFTMWLGVLIVLAAAYVINGQIIRTLKHHFEYPRPYVALANGQVTVLESMPSESDYVSFPSGHAAFITMMIVGMWPALPSSMRWLGVITIFAVCWSRLALGVHFPADVVTGVFITLIVVNILRAIIYSVLRKIGINCG